MKIAIMQPYFFPYAGYFHLATQVDRFILYDDVNYIKNGWINRNRYLHKNQPAYFTVPVIGVSSNALICDVLVQNPKVWQRKLTESIRHAYSKAPYFQQGYDLLCEALANTTGSIATLATRSIMLCAALLNLKTEFVETSKHYGNAYLKGSDRVLDICSKEKASEYFNLPGGRTLYTISDFASRNIILTFVDTQLVPYPQYNENFIPGLSMLDILMFNSVDEARALITTRQL